MALSFTYNQDKINVGDRIAVHQRVQEDDKSRTQIFDGLVIAVKGRGDNQTFTIRKIGPNNIGVEKIIPVNWPFIQNIDVKARGKVRRSKLYYLRGRKGRQALRVKDQARRNGKTSQART